eukprot:1361277-Amorphochlora_amoeboformis.AAC.1
MTWIDGYIDHKRGMANGGHGGSCHASRGKEVRLSWIDSPQPWNGRRHAGTCPDFTRCDCLTSSTSRHDHAL